MWKTITLPFYLLAGIVFGAIGGIIAAYDDWQNSDKENDDGNMW